jgi:histidyl-tRNA synthetase
LRTAPQFLFLNLGYNEAEVAMQAITALRRQGISAELYPDAAKWDKQFKYAEKRGVPYVIRSIEQEVYSVKNLATGEVLACSWEQLTAL